MSVEKNETLERLCDHLTRNGETLSITWSGGNDSGYYELLLDGKCIGDDDGNNPIINHIADKMGYHSFDGNFSTSGELIYNRHSKCFCGTDDFEEPGTGLKMCSIDICIPKTLWFDQFRLEVLGYDDSIEAVHVDLHIQNGPFTDSHSRIENAIKEQISEEFEKLVENIPDFEGCDFELAINSNAFTEEGIYRVHSIREFEYGHTVQDQREVSIDMTRQNHLS